MQDVRFKFSKIKVYVEIDGKDEQAFEGFSLKAGSDELEISAGEYHKSGSCTNKQLNMLIDARERISCEGFSLRHIAIYPGEKSTEIEVWLTF